MYFKRSVIVTIVAMLVGCGQPVPEGTVVGASTRTSDIAGDTVDIDENQQGGNTVLAGANGSADGFQSLYFGFDNYEITPEMESVIVHNARNAAQKPNGRIRIEGNCDEFGSDEYNYALGLKRAKAVKEAMVLQGVPQDRMILVSYGESNPVCNEHNERCYAQNRRVDLRLIR